jgi:hypothetical protein
MGFELQAGVEYWFCFYPQGGCPPFTSTCTWGCITVTFEGVNFLELLPNEDSLNEDTSTHRPRYTKVVIEGRGVFIRDEWTGAIYDLITRETR